MIPPTCVRRSVFNGKPLWYDTNIPLPKDQEMTLILYHFWNHRWQGLHIKAMVKGSYDWIAFRLIYSRLIELRKELERYESKS